MAPLYDPSNLYIFHIISTTPSPLKAFLFLTSILIIYQILSSLGPNPIREKSWPFLFLLIPLLVFFGTLPWGRRMPLLNLGVLGVYIVCFFGYLESLEGGDEEVDREELLVV
jgi:hypothetical protein